MPTTAPGASAADAPAGEVTPAPARGLARVLLLLALVVAGVGMAPSLEEGPWRLSWLGHNGARYAQIARNTVRLGPTHLGGAPLLDPAGGGPAGPEVYAHHPPGVSMALAALFGLAGEGEQIARLFAAGCTLLGLALLARLVGRESGRPLSGALAALTVAVLPMTWAYGAHVDPQGPPVLTASLAVLLAFGSWRRGGSPLPWMALSALASFLDWWGLYAPAGCALVLLAQGRWRPALLMAGWTTVLFAGWVGWLTSLPGFSLGGLSSAAGVRGPALLFAEDPAARAALGAAVQVWFTQSLRLMPGWPLLVLVGLVLAARGRPGSDDEASNPASAGSARLGVAPLLGLLLLPPLVHGLVFPAGMLVHGYWLFGLPVGLGAVVGLFPRPGGPLHGALPALVLVALLGGLGWSARAELYPDQPSELPALLGQAVAGAVGEGELVLTNYDANPLRPGAEGLEYLAKRPEVTYYADRPLRGLVEADPEAGAPGGEGATAGAPAGDLARYEEARRRCPGARWFLLTPWPRPVDPALRARLEAEATEVRTLSQEPLVQLFGLTP